METLVGLFKSYEDAEKAVESLKVAGFKEEAITLLTRQSTFKNDPEEPETESDQARMAQKNALSGGILGGLSGLIVGLGAVIVPGLGPVFAGGALATALASTGIGAGVGAAAGGVVGALIGQGVSEKEAQIYAEGVKRGGILVMVDVEEGHAEPVHTILKNASAVNIDRTAEEWKRSGWTGFEETAEPDDTYPRMWGSMYNQR